MIVLNAGAPRSGTVLVNGIVRAVLSQRDLDVRQINAHEGEVPEAIADGGRMPPSIVAVIHTHSWSPECAAAADQAEDLIVFACYRDPRDVCVSLMFLHDLDLEEALEFTIAAFANLDAMRRDTDVTLFAYERLIADTRHHVGLVACRLGASLSTFLVEQILAETSIERRRERMKRVRAGSLPRLRLLGGRNRILKEDPETLINDRHIQSGKPGRWRTELTRELQMRAAFALCDEIQRYGYPSD